MRKNIIGLCIIKKKIPFPYPPHREYGNELPLSSAIL